MEAVRQVIDGQLLNGIVRIPKHFLDKKLEVIVIPMIEAVDKPLASEYESITEMSDAWEGLQKYKGILNCDIDEKAELTKARDEKYADFG